MFDEKTILKFDFNKLQKCLSSPHSAGIGLWAHWWLSTHNNKAIVLDSIERVYNKDYNKSKNKKWRWRQADLIFCNLDGKRIGLLEFENDYYKYLDKVNTIKYYEQRTDIFPDFEFGILTAWSVVKGVKGYRKDKFLEINSIMKSVKNKMNKYSRISKEKFRYILYNIKWGFKEGGFLANFINYEFQRGWISS